MLRSGTGAPCGLAGLRNQRSPAVLAAGAAPLAGMPTSRQSASRVTRKILPINPLPSDAMRPAKVCARGKCGRWPPGLGGVGSSLWRCAVVAFGVVSVVSVRGLRAGDQSVVYVGRRCAGWEGSVLGNPFRLGSGGGGGVGVGSVPGLVAGGRGGGVGGFGAVGWGGGGVGGVGSVGGGRAVGAVGAVGVLVRSGGGHVSCVCGAGGGGVPGGSGVAVVVSAGGRRFVLSVSEVFCVCSVFWFVRLCSRRCGRRLDPRVRGRRVAWRRSSPRCSFLWVCLRPRWVLRAGVGCAAGRGWLALLASGPRGLRSGSCGCGSSALRCSGTDPLCHWRAALQTARRVRTSLRVPLKRSCPSAQIAQRKTSILSPKHPAEHPPCATRPKHPGPPNHRANSHIHLAPTGQRKLHAQPSTHLQLSVRPTTSPGRTAIPRADRPGDQRRDTLRPA